MAHNVQDGYQKLYDDEPLILEPVDWPSDEWATICKLCGLPLGQAERIVLHISEMECYVNLRKKVLDRNRTYIVTEWCSNCESEIEMRWDTDTRGFEAFCPVCGERLVLCDECLHAEDNPTHRCGTDEGQTVCWRLAQAETLKHESEEKA